MKRKSVKLEGVPCTVTHYGDHCCVRYGTVILAVGRREEESMSRAESVLRSLRQELTARPRKAKKPYGWPARYPT